MALRARSVRPIFPPGNGSRNPYFLAELTSVRNGPLTADPPVNATASWSVAGLPPFWSYIACGIRNARSTVWRGNFAARAVAAVLVLLRRLGLALDLRRPRERFGVEVLPESTCAEFVSGAA